LRRNSTEEETVSSLPGLLVLAAALASLLGIGVGAPVFVERVAWRLAAGFIAIRRASGMNVAKSGLALLIGVASGVVAVAISSRVLVEILYSFGVSS